jgi:hypothetical protein
MDFDQEENDSTSNLRPPMKLDAFAETFQNVGNIAQRDQEQAFFKMAKIITDDRLATNVK